MWVISVWSHPVIQIHDGKSVGNIIMRQSVAWNWYAVPSHYQSSAGDPIEKSLEFNFKWETKKLKISVRIKSPERNGPDGCIQLDTDSSSPLERCPCQDTTAGELFIYFIKVVEEHFPRSGDFILQFNEFALSTLLTTVVHYGNYNTMI